jgi:hypothetical protein
MLFFKARLRDMYSMNLLNAICIPTTGAKRSMIMHDVLASTASFNFLNLFVYILRKMFEILSTTQMDILFDVGSTKLKHKIRWHDHSNYSLI